MDAIGRHGGYDDFVAEFYDLEYSPSGVFAAQPGRMKDVGFFVEQSRAAKGETLELGCGTGRVLIPTAAAGCQITGLDLSEFMLDKCLQNLALQAATIQSRVHLVLGDMTDFNLEKEFALATIPFRPFQHLVAVAEQKACLSCVNKHLLPGGHLVFDVFNPELRSLFDPSYLNEKEDTAEVSLQEVLFVPLGLP